MSDQTYTNLLSHLHRPSVRTPPRSTLQALVVHHLASLTPTPTPLAAAIVSSSLFRPFSFEKLDTLCTCFRHAVHAKFRGLKEEPNGLFVPSQSARLSNWSKSLLRGFDGGHAIVRLACCSGLIQGLEDILPTLPEKQRGIKEKVEDGLILAVADVIDLFTSSDSWGKEFQPVTEGGEDALTLPLIISSHALLLVPPEKFVALPLQQMLSLVTRAISNAFDQGDFMSTFSSHLESNSEFPVSLSVTAPIRAEINAIASSHAMIHMGNLSKLCSRSISLFVDYRAKLAFPRVHETFLTLETITTKVEAAWLDSGLPGVEQDSIAPETRTVTTSIWSIFKTLLFCLVMITEAGLSTSVYVPPANSGSISALALIALRALSHLAFVIEKFGGAGHGAFDELKRSFYLALDLLANDASASEHFVKGICDEIWSTGFVPTHSVHQAKKAFALSALEQLVPVLNTTTIRNYVFPFCSPHLTDSLHRETFESAHSVVLSIFSALSKRIIEHPSRPGNPIMSDSALIEKMVPFYLQCLIENSDDGKLNVGQLCLSFTALVKSASLTRSRALVWLCIDTVITACKELPQDVSRLQRLNLVLVSSISSLPLSLLPRLLSIVRDIVNDTKDKANRKELVETLFEQIMENVGDAEKEYAVRWWNERRVEWSGEKLVESSLETSEPKRLDVTSRL